MSEIYVGGSIEVRCLDWAILMMFDSSSLTRLGIFASWTRLRIASSWTRFRIASSWTRFAMTQLAFDSKNRLQDFMACTKDVTGVHARGSRKVVTVGPVFTRVGTV